MMSRAFYRNEGYKLHYIFMRYYLYHNYSSLTGPSMVSWISSSKPAVTA